ncbi:dynein regulatory complex subunit 3 [Frankliniella occidentalis]|uniref:Dynein axonemal assembly factor 1 homolog n=1 Tax=Frankliniella occidentalis TaxID=133901 RepID=A0A9C6UCY8_FRAOC|nr:dynein regulatory complex subunit 3 [Frankliniella occidentalis]
MSVTRRLERLKLEEKIAKLARVHEHLLPGVIDMDMINKHVYEQGPKGEAGRVAQEEGIDLGDVTALRLEYLRILKIDHLWVLPNLTKLQLNNNSIESIDNLHTLIHLKELDLSFNHIQVIENLEELSKLEILHLYQNHISCLENLENQKSLTLLSLGLNHIEDCESTILYLRRFRKLKSLNLAGNPMCGKEKFVDYVYAFLPDLVFFEYTMISKKDKELAKEIFREELSSLQSEEEKHLAEKLSAEQEAAEIELHSVAFVERLNSNQLFQAMFENDTDGQTLVKISEETKEFYETFCEEMTALCRELFQMGQEQHVLRKKEHDDFTNCVNEAKLKSQQESQKILEAFVEQQKNIKDQVGQMLNFLSSAEDDGESDNRSEIIAESAMVISNCVAEFDDLIQNTWRILMHNELSLTEQMEEVNSMLERDMSDMVNVMLEQALGYFVAMRSLQESFNEQLTEASHRYQTVIALDSDDAASISSQLREIMIDKESLSNALANSHEKHLLVIDTREDILMTRIKAWHEEVCENLQKREVARSRARVLEINRFLDLQRDEFEEMLASRPDDLILLMEVQAQEKGRGITILSSEVAEEEGDEREEEFQDQRGSDAYDEKAEASLEADNPFNREMNPLVQQSQSSHHSSGNILDE